MPGVIRVGPGQLAPVHWPDASLPRLLVLRPTRPPQNSERPGPGPGDRLAPLEVLEISNLEFEWSGALEPQEREDYLGLRLLSRDCGRSIILPIHMAGGEGTVLLTVKNPTSTPPYRIENRCSGLIVRFLQQVGRPAKTVAQLAASLARVDVSQALRGLQESVAIPPAVLWERGQQVLQGRRMGKMPSMRGLPAHARPSSRSKSQASVSDAAAGSARTWRQLAPLPPLRKPASASFTVARTLGISRRKAPTDARGGVGPGLLPESSRVISIGPQQSVGYAFDEPLAPHVLLVEVMGEGVPGAASVLVSVPLDTLGDLDPLVLPFTGRQPQVGRAEQEAAEQVPREMQSRVARLLAGELSRRVYITVAAEGPTRVLRLSDMQHGAGRLAQQTLTDLSSRVRQMEAELKEVNGRFARFQARGSNMTIDLFGRHGHTEAATEPRVGRVLSDLHPVPVSVCELRVVWLQTF